MYEIEHFQDFDETPKEKRPAYVASELRRIVRERKPLVSTVLRHPDDDVKLVALTLIRDGVTEAGDSVFEAGQVANLRLRLVEGAEPPPKDPQGRAIPPERRGNVLVCKVGNKGGRLPEDAPGKQVAAFSGPRRQVLVSAGASLYELAEVGRTWKAYPLRIATLILRTWGYGCNPQERLSTVDKATGETVFGQVLWLVEEEPQDPAALLGDEDEGEKPQRPQKAPQRPQRPPQRAEG